MIQLSNLELYKSKVAEFLETKLNELEFAADWELMDDPLLVPVYINSSGQKTLTPQSGLHAATEQRNYLHNHRAVAQSILYNVNFESLVFPNLESVPDVYDAGPFYQSLYGCPEIKNLYFPELKSLGNFGLRFIVDSCPNLCKMEFPKLESIGQYAFEEDFKSCPKLKDIYFPSLVSVKSGAFNATGTEVKLHFKKSLEGNSKFTASYLKISNPSQIVFDI